MSRLYLFELFVNIWKTKHEEHSDGVKTRDVCGIKSTTDSTDVIGFSEERNSHSATCRSLNHLQEPEHSATCRSLNHLQESGHSATCRSLNHLQEPGHSATCRSLKTAALQTSL
ncbi:hypothetical protein WMY93_031626 [Mugilogobius chulae]|uniref:Uncharacterized protein n=1 Tax=Mugilogobius chulae TaxID=88201 RepID=A0AAW0MLJ4_9GOBI